MVDDLVKKVSTRLQARFKTTSVPTVWRTRVANVAKNATATSFTGSSAPSYETEILAY